MDDGPSTIEAARDAYERRDFRAAYRALSTMPTVADLDADDLWILADAAWWLGRITECLRTSEEVHRRYLASGQVDRAATRALEIALHWFLRGEHVIASGWVNRARRLVGDRPLGEAHCLLAYLDAWDHLAAMRLDEAAAGATALRRMGETLGSPTYAALGLVCEGVAEIRSGQVRRGFALLDEAMLPVVAGEVEPAWVGNIYCTIISTCYDLADLDRAREWERATEQWCAQFSDAVMFLGVCRAHKVQILAGEGSWSDIEREVALVRDDLADLNVEAVAESEYQLGDVLRLRGQSQRAAECFATARRLGRDPQPGEAYLQLASGRATAAWEAICAAVVSAPGLLPCARLLRAQVCIGLATGHVDDAAAAALRLEELRRTYRTPGFEAWADHATGAVLLARGRAEEAVVYLKVAAQRHHRMGAAHDVALAELDLAAAHRSLGDHEAATGHERSASALLERLGQPVPPGAPGAPAPGGLTRRELEVLQLVARGVTNREAAADLGVSEATVRRHLANIYLKLGVSSRTAAAAWAHDHSVARGAS
ncbi:helix-turn-helix transcriptional regulator [Nocardioides sp.]|uniref:helix-turn-helix domain-containing protein n=1 Tax=Nocardioides sp. TaxID=35761 RepID=UPI002732D005|nr:helix-turn-helix transcriptional regulator [Nocardioides sp.]MDP3893262.1 helix-turn-helix transcriptional regulator [Nocardioides sp.]